MTVNLKVVAAGAAGLVAAGAATAVLLTGGASDQTFAVNKIAQTSKTITLGWSPQPGADGYSFAKDGAVVSRTFDPSKTTVKFSLGTSYTVTVLDITAGATGSYPAPPPATTTDTTPTTTVPSGKLLELSGTYSNAAFAQAVSNMGSDGYLTVRPKAGATATLQCGTFPARNHTTYERIVFDGCNNTANNWVANWQDWKIVGGTIKNYYVANDPASHSEGLYVGGCSSDGLVDGVTFDHNGTTAHIFFTWFGGNCGGGAYDTNNYPRNICVKNSHYANGLNPYFAIQYRDEIPADSTIYVDPSNVFVGPGSQRALTPCP